MTRLLETNPNLLPQSRFPSSKVRFPLRDFSLAVAWLHSFRLSITRFCLFRFRVAISGISPSLYSGFVEPQDLARLVQVRLPNLRQCSVTIAALKIFLSLY